MRVLRLKAVNIKALEDFDLEPDANIVIIGGDNAQGKSTAIECIEMALRGATSIPPRPVREGAELGEIELCLGDDADNPELFVHVKTTKERKTTLKLLGADKKPVGSPQKLLDKLYSHVSFSPVGFMGAAAQKQAEILRGLLGIDTREIEKRRKELFDDRTVVNREVRSLESRVDSMKFHPNMPEEEKSVQEVMDLIRGAERHNAQIRETQSEIYEDEGIVNECEEQIRRLTEQIAEHRSMIGKNEKKLKELGDPKDAAELEAQAESLEETNRKIRENASRAAVRADLEEKRSQAGSLSEEIERLDAEKAEFLKECHYPVEGLDVTTDGVTFNGVPLEQCSQSEKIRVSMAVGMGLNPQLKVLLIKEGAYFDRNSMKLVCDMATEKGFQVWIERVGDGDVGAIVIEDGKIR